MNAPKLMDIARRMVAADKGLLAMDESNPTCNRRFARLGIRETEDARRTYREMIVTTPGLKGCISGLILYDETIRQRLRDSTPLVKAVIDAGMIPGIKVDTGKTVLAGHPEEQITEGLDGLRDRLAEYARMGARFAKWRAAIAVAEDIPSRGCIEANAQMLARYAALCQEAGIVPVVEPEVLMDGAHTLERCAEVTEEVLRVVFFHLNLQRVMLEGMILNPNMVLPGLICPRQGGVDEVADATVRCLLRTIPAAVPGIAFLSGGQPSELASARLNAMHVRFKGRLPWALSFSFARAVQQPALEIWRGSEANVLKAQQALYHRARCNQAARRFFDYVARGVPYGPDDGTLALWAIVVSLPFAPELVLSALHHCILQAKLIEYNADGLKASFNPSHPGDAGNPYGWWVSPWQYGIDQRPIILMIENHRNGLPWQLMRKCRYISNGLQRAGFEGGWL